MSKYVKATFQMRSDNAVCILPAYRYLKSRWEVQTSDGSLESYNVTYGAKSVQLSPSLADRLNGGVDRFDNAFQLNNFIINNNFSVCDITCKIEVRGEENFASNVMVSSITKLNCSVPRYNIRAPVRIVGKPNDYYFVTFYFQNMLGTYQYVLQSQDSGALLARVASVNGVFMLVMELIAEENLH